LESEVSLLTIGSLTNPRGGHGDMPRVPFHTGNTLGASPSMFRQFCGDIGLRKEVADRVCDGPNGFNVGRLTKWAEDYTSTYVSMGLCIRPIITRSINLKELSELYLAATGLEMSPAQLMEAGERVFNVLKAFNVKAGAKRRDDMPPAWPPDKPLVMEGKEYGTLDQILNQYYDERGWDVHSGIPTRKKLTALGLESIADDIAV